MMKSIKRFVIPLAMLVVGSGCSGRILVEPSPQFAPVDLSAIEIKPDWNGSIFQDGRSIRLFEDNKAFRVGDILSVRLSESTNASKSAATNTSKDNDITIEDAIAFGSAGPTLDGNLLFSNSIDAERTFAGSGDSAQSNSLSGEITVTVANILSNGNLAIRGEKIIGLNQGSEFIRISGLVRPQDVGTDNVVLSRKVANAQIYYGGGGSVAEANTKGWLTRLFDSPWFPL